MMNKKSQQLWLAAVTLLVALQLATFGETRNLPISAGDEVPDLSQQQLRQSVLENQLSLEDEHTMRRQLPDLIARARNDRNLERALLKMLINAASMRSSAIMNQGWQEGKAEAVQADNGVPAPRMSARLEQVIDSLGTSYPMRDQYETVVDKREYIKPCFFNAVSCAKNPSRKF